MMVGIWLLRFLVLGDPIINQQWSSWLYWSVVGWLIASIFMDKVFMRVDRKKRRFLRNGLASLNIQVIFISVTAYCLLCFLAMAVPGNSTQMSGQLVWTKGSKTWEKICIQFDGQPAETIIPLASPTDPLHFKAGFLNQGERISAVLKPTFLGTVVSHLKQDNI